jgi:transglutaminase/protease-like cytokinesis protein 3
MSAKMTVRWLALLLAAFSFFSIRLVAQDDTTSVADAARRARQQKQSAAKPAHVIDNDAIPPSPAASAAPSSDSGSAAPAETASSSAVAPKSGTDTAKEEKEKAEIEALKQQVADKKAKADLQRREMSLAQDSYLSNPEHENDKAGKEKLESMQSDLTQAQAELTELQAKLAALAPAPETKTPETPEPAKP